MEPQSIYIDTNILIFYFDTKHKEVRNNVRICINRVKRALENPQIKIKVPQVVLGELVLAHCSNKCELDRILQLLNDLNADKPAANEQVLEIAIDLLKLDSLLKPNDALIVAHALYDSEAKWLLTTDTNLIANPNIKREMQKLEHEFTISDSFRTH